MMYPVVSGYDVAHPWIRLKSRAMPPSFERDLSCARASHSISSNNTRSEPGSCASKPARSKRRSASATAGQKRPILHLASESPVPLLHRCLWVPISRRKMACCVHLQGLNLPVQLSWTRPMPGRLDHFISASIEVRALHVPGTRCRRKRPEVPAEPTRVPVAIATSSAFNQGARFLGIAFTSILTQHQTSTSGIVSPIESWRASTCFRRTYVA